MAHQQSKLLPQEFIDEVKLANNIVGVASRYMPLKQKGRQHWACCPFHSEKTPSFAINDTQQFYKCFGCGAAGNVISLVKQLESVDFMGAIELLAKWANLTMPKLAADPDYAKRKEKKERMFEMVECARAYYCETLYRPIGRDALNYLHGRGITDELIKTFNIGLSHDWDALIGYMRKKGYRDEELIEAGIAAKSERSGRIYDAMAERITFAIFDVYGSCIGFTGRTLSDKADIAKYRNTAQTMLFDKSAIAYGIDVLKKNKQSNFVESLIVVEGNVDVITMVGAGFINTVACMGTALTQFHARVYKRFAQNILLLFDGDNAGQRAAMRAVDILDAEGLSVKVIELPPDTDPDTFVTKHGKLAMAGLIQDAKPMMDFKLDHLESESDLSDNAGRTKYLDAATEMLKPLANQPQLELYIPKVAKLATVSYEAVERKVNQAPPKTKEPSLEPPPPERISNKYTAALDFILWAAVTDQPYATTETLLTLHIQNGILNRILQNVMARRERGSRVNVGMLLGELGEIDHEEESDKLRAIAGMDFTHMDTRGQTEHFAKCVATINETLIKKQTDDLMEKFRQTDDSLQRMEILQQIETLKKKGAK
ncbi:MAG: DNA primase [Firmicutes bacterium]|nr:DNA primase [Bacillota bacterium]